MKFIQLLLFVFPFSLLSQQLEIDQNNLKINTTFQGKELNYIDSIFHHTKFHIEIVALLPECRTGECYVESILKENYDDENWKLESTYFIGVKEQLIDSAKLAHVKQEDYNFFLTELLKGPQKHDPKEIITTCYNPRHAVLFKDDLGKIIAIQEICFECGNTMIGIYYTKLLYNTSYPFQAYFKQYGIIN